MQHKNDLIGLFTQHKLAANLTMLLMLMAGFWGLSKLNTQFFPDFELDIVSVRIVWSGASAEDIEKGITNPVEEALRNLDNLKEMTSTSSRGISAITLEYIENTDMGNAVDQVKEQIGLIRELPETAEEPEVSLIVRYEPVARLLVTGPSLRELRPLVNTFERQLLDKGISKISISGLPEEQIAIQVSMQQQQELGLSLDKIAATIRDSSRDIPAGTIGRDNVARQLRSLEQRRDINGFSTLPIITDDSGGRTTLGDIADIERMPRDNQVLLAHNGKPSVELYLRRAKGDDSLESARILQEWLAEQTLPEGFELKVFDETWDLIKQRIGLLLKNGLGGLVLVMGILFLFLHGRVAFWVAMGIPVSFMATLAILYLAGGSINMISLFAMIMALGIIVDDAIVVGEDALSHYQAGEKSLTAAEGGARRMLSPVLASSLTTIAAFLPLMLIGGIIGNILIDIPIVVICVIIASLVECFLVLPGHLKRSMQKMSPASISPKRKKLDQAFADFRENHFRKWVTFSVNNRGATISAAAAMLIISIGLIAGGRLSFVFFPSVEGSIIVANASFVAGTPRHEVDSFMQSVDEALVATEKKLGEGLIVTAIQRKGSLSQIDSRPSQSGDEFGSIMLELTPSDERQVSNTTFIEEWQSRIKPPNSIEAFTIASRRSGHRGSAIDISLSGASATVLKSAATQVVATLHTLEGVSNIEDDMPWGHQQLIYSLTPRAEALGLSINEIGSQLRAAFDGHIAQIFHDGFDEIEVRVILPEEERNNLLQLENIGIALNNGHMVPLSTVVELQANNGFDVLRHSRAYLATHIYANVDRAVANENDIRSQLINGILSTLKKTQGINYSFEGKAADQKETMQDMKQGAIIAFLLIYFILAWVFSSWGKPFVIMATIPFAIIGAIIGHWVMGMDLTVLSLFGVFGLTGIVVNDSIILMSFYDHQRRHGMAIQDAIIEAACQRLRAVLLTSLTTIAGLLPLLFETSLQAQFLIPMATSISFGLGFSTLLVLFVIPSLMSVYESVIARLGLVHQDEAANRSNELNPTG